MPSESRELQHPTPRREEIESLLDRIRPGLLADGGNLELLGLDDDGTLKIVLQGACAGCPAQLATLRVAIEEPLRKALPGITAVVAV